MLVYAAAAAIFTWPLVLHPFSLLASTQGPGDSYLNLWILGWDLQAILHHPASVLSGRVFDANIFYPAGGTLAFSDHLLLQAVALGPIYLLTGNLTFCYNVLFLASLVLAALAMHGYAREVVRDPRAAWVAGLAWGFAPYHFSHLTHLQLQALYFLPLTFLLLHRVAANLRRRDAWLLGLALAAQALSSVYYGVIGGVGVTIAGIVFIADAGRARARAVFLRLLLAAAVGSAIVAPVALNYWWVQQREGFGRSLHEASQGSAAGRAYLEVPPVNLIYARTGLLHPHNAADQIHKASEQNLLPGFVLLGLAVIGASTVRRKDVRATTLMLVAVTVAGFVLSLGPDGVRPLYAVLYERVFGFQAIRAPARFAVLVLFGLAGLAALGVDVLLRRVQKDPPYVQTNERRPGPLGPGVIVIVLLLALEYANAPIPYVPAPLIYTPAGSWLRAAQEPGAVLYLPLELDPVSNTVFMVQSLEHGRSIVNGYSGERPAFFPGLVDAVARFPSADTLRVLLDLGVRFVVAPGPVDAAALPPSALIERARFSDSVVYEIRESPELDSALTTPDVPPLPDPASIPFSIGEQVVYSVIWSSGPLPLPAGRITLEVGPGKNGARYELAASGTTADWVSTFFQADEHFISEVDGRLRSLSFEQHSREGRRQVDRRAVFDRNARVVRLRQGSGPDISFPIPADALDPLATFYYARTLPLAPGSAVLIPMNDTNRNLVLDLRVGGVEMISYNGVQTEAVHTTAQIRRAQGTLPAQLAIWFGRDHGRVPLRAEISGIVGVGAVRLELESAR